MRHSLLVLATLALAAIATQEVDAWINKRSFSFPLSPSESSFVATSISKRRFDLSKWSQSLKLRVSNTELTSEPASSPTFSVTSSPPLSTTSKNSSVSYTAEKSSQNLLKRWVTGLALTAIATLWVAFGNGVFATGFFFASFIAQMEFFAMAKNTGVTPAFGVGIVSSALSFVTATVLPQYHELAMPLSASLLVLWLLLTHAQSPSIAEIATSLLGMFYLGYLPSFWVRLRAADAVGVGRRSLPALDRVMAAWGPADTSSAGALAIGWTWVAIAAADICAFFVGKRFGRHKLSSISRAAGAASPNKTVEGALGGALGCSLIACLGAYHMRWPHWRVTGAAYGALLALIALAGDLTASMLKRDAKVKDSGRLLPGHGGVLDRLDSYLLTAPVAFVVCARLLPLLAARSSS